MPERGDHGTAVAGLRHLPPAAVAGVAALLLLLDELSRAAPTPDGRVPALSLGAGLLLAVFLVAEARRWPHVLAASFAAGGASALLHGEPLAGGVAGAGALAGGALLGALAVRRLDRGAAAVPPHERLGPIVGAALLVAGPVAAGLGAGLRGGATSVEALLVRWGSAAVGALVVAPLALALGAPPGAPARPGRRVEAAAAIGLLLATCVLIFWVSPVRFLPGVMIAPPLVWAALRLEARTTAILVAAMACGGAWASAAGHGRFAFDASGQVVNFQLFAAVVGGTALLAAGGEGARRRARARLELIEAAVNRAGDALFLLTPDGQVAWANDVACQLAGRGREAVVGAAIAEVLGEGAGESWLGRAGEARQAEPFLREIGLPAPGGGVVHWELAARAVEVGGRSYLVAALRDISDRRKAEAALRVAGLGTMAAGMAHEINNPLAFVAGNLAFLREGLDRLGAGPGAGTGDPPGTGTEGEGAGRAGGSPEVAELAAAALDAEQGAARIRDIVKDLKLLTRGSGGAVGRVDAGAALRSAVAIAQNEVRHRARLAVAIAADLPAVTGNEHRLTQVCLNLLLNAAQAVPEGQAGRHEVRVSAAVERGEVVLTVADDGCGMTPEVKARVFEPFFTTRAEGGGSGLGLSICHGIVGSMGGRIELESAPGAGTTFRVVLPAAPGTAAAPAPAPAAAAAPGRRLRVLVVDDEEKLGVVARRLLAGEAEVTACQSPARALALVREGQPFDAVLCDVMMPEMSGEAFAAALAREAPALAERIGFLTGGAFTPGAAAFLERTHHPRLGKPFEARELRGLLATLASPGAVEGARRRQGGG